MLQIISKIFPIIVLFTIGIFIRKNNYLSIFGMNEIKKTSCQYFFACCSF